MKTPIQAIIVAALAAGAITGCSASAGQTTTATTPSPASRTGASAAKSKNNPADVEFMQGMIPHHAQAVVIAAWAPTHGARDDIRRLCERIVVGQADEIRLMQWWLKEKGEDIPAADAKTHKMKMGDMVHEMLMPGMLNDEQLARLDKARGSEFDRIFLEAMIAHHAGAIAMVDKLFGASGGANDDLVYKMASDVYADQTTEIRVMENMLSTVPGATRAP
jgi:uncharacterized protein (DUF305 family)